MKVFYFCLCVLLMGCSDKQLNKNASGNYEPEILTINDHLALMVYAKNGQQRPDMVPEEEILRMDGFEFKRNEALLKGCVLAKINGAWRPVEIGHTRCPEK